MFQASKNTNYTTHINKQHDFYTKAQQNKYNNNKKNINRYE